MTWANFLQYMTRTEWGDVRGPHAPRATHHSPGSAGNYVQVLCSEQLPGEWMTSNGHGDVRGITREVGQ
jgi:hypothetical protein